MMTLEPEPYARLLAACYYARRPLFAWGGYGIGKSDIVAQVAEALDLALIDTRLSQIEPVDLRGIPVPVDGRTVWFPAHFIPSESAGIWFFDEMNCAHPSILKACYQIIHGFKVGELPIAEDWTPIAAGNRQQDGGATYSLPIPLARRMCHVELVPSIDAWLDWASGAPRKLRVHQAKRLEATQALSSETIAFIKWRPELLNKPNPDDPYQDPNPRSWTMLDDLLRYISPADDTVRRAAINGLVGDAAGTEYYQFLQTYKDLVTYDEIRQDPVHTPVPRDVSALYAVATMIAMRLKVSEPKIWSYILRLPADYQTYLVVMAIKRDSKLMACDGYRQWAIKNHDVIM